MSFRSVPIPGLVDKNGKQRNKTIPTHWNERQLVEKGPGRFAWLCPISETAVCLDADLRDKDVFVVTVETFSGRQLHSEVIENTHSAIWKSMTHVFARFDPNAKEGYFAGDDQ